MIAANCEGTATVGGLSATTKPGSGQDVCIFRLDPDGKPLSAGVHGEQSTDVLRDMALTPQGGAVVVGLAIGPVVQGFVALIP